MNPTKQQQRLLAKYGTHDEAEIVRLKSSLPQFKAVPVQAKNALVILKPEECKALCEAAGFEYLDGYEARVIEYTLSDESIDRDGDILIQAGADLKNFWHNPVTLKFHDGRDYPVGNFIKVWVDVGSKALKGWILFVDDRVDMVGVAERAFRFAKSRIMRAGSIGFRGHEVKFPTKEERFVLGMRDYGVLFTKWELLEFSICPVPSNPNALSAAVKSGALMPTDLQFVELPEDEEIPMTKEELDAYLKAEIPKALAAATVEKAGRTVSKATMARLKKMHERATEACSEIKALIDEHEEEEEEKPKADPAPVQKSAEEIDWEALAAEVKTLVPMAK